MEATDDHRKELATAMNRRRAELRTTWDKVAARGGISVATLRRARNGKGEITLDTVIAIEQGLEWEEGRVDAIRSGREPVALHKEHAPPVPPMPPGLGLDPKEWARYEPIDRENIINALRLAGERAAGENAHVHSNGLQRKRSA